ALRIGLGCWTSFQAAGFVQPIAPWVAAPAGATGAPGGAPAEVGAALGGASSFCGSGALSWQPARAGARARVRIETRFTSVPFRLGDDLVHDFARPPADGVEARVAVEP